MNFLLLYCWDDSIPVHRGLKVKAEPHSSEFLAFQTRFLWQNTLLANRAATSPHQEPHQAQGNYLLSLPLRVEWERLLLPALLEGLEGGLFLPCATLWHLEVNCLQQNQSETTGTAAAPSSAQHQQNSAHCFLLRLWAQPLQAAQEAPPHSTHEETAQGHKSGVSAAASAPLCTWRGSFTIPGWSQRSLHTLCSA